MDGTMRKALAIVAALSMIGAACSSQQGLPRDIDFALVASEDVAPSVDRNPRVVVPGGEVVTGGVAEGPAEVSGLRERVGFAGSAPSLADYEALLVVAGGVPVACPWEPFGVEVTGSEQVSIAVGDYADVDCGVEWRPRAVALRVDAEDLPPIQN